MTPPSDTPPEHDDPQGKDPAGKDPSGADPEGIDPIEELLTEALGIIETEGQAGLQEFLTRHPSEATELREALEALDRMELLEQRTGAIPEQFGDFVIKEELGKGGMGVVFVAEQQSLTREVALKIVRPELLLFDGARERFRREIESVARLEHPAIIPILATGTTNDIPYYAMPRLRGRDAESVMRALRERSPQQLRAEDLRKVIDSDATGSQSDTNFGVGYWQAIVRLIHQAALGIEHAHLRGVLHRDLKPSNIFFTTTGQAVVLDFGLARAGEDPQLTRSGAAAGSPAYMAPEQVRGQGTDERTDVYGLAATLHCLLALQPPFGSDSTEALRSRILAGERTDLRQRSDLPPELLVVLDCALDVDPMHRYPSAQAFADDLLAVLDGGQIRARKLPRRVRMQRMLQRHPTLSSVAAITLGFFLLLPLMLWQQEQQAKEVLASQVAKTRDANRDLELANGELAHQARVAQHNLDISLDAISQLLSGLSTEKLRHHIGAQPVVLEMLQNALQLFDQLPAEETQLVRLEALRYETMSRLSFLHQAMGKQQLGEQVLDRGLALMADRELPMELKVYRARLQLQKAVILKRRNRDEAVQLVHHARKTLDDAVAEGADEYHVFVKLSDALTMCGHIADENGDHELAEREFRASIEAAYHDETIQTTSACKLQARLELARFYRKRHRYDEALQVLDVLVAHGSTQQGDTISWPRPEMIVARALNERHAVLAQAGHQRESLHPLHRAIETYDKLIPEYRDIGELYKERGRAKGNLAVRLTDWGIYDDAIEWTRSAIADQQQALKLTPGLRVAENYLQNHRLLLTICLRHQRNWPELERAAIHLGNMRLPAVRRVSAAKDLLRCSHHASRNRAKQLRDWALMWLAAAHKANYPLYTNDPVYDCVRSDPRFQKLQ